ncbi:MAG: diguanylate cyclase [Alphaproteobacteria bacterium]
MNDFLNIATSTELKADAQSRQGVLFFDDSGQPPEDSVLGLDTYNFNIITIKSPDELLKRAMDSNVVAIIIRQRRGQKRILKIIASFAHFEGGLQIIFLTEDATLESRIQALRAGVDTYVLAPCDEMELVDCISTATSHYQVAGKDKDKDPIKNPIKNSINNPMAFRVLLIEEDAASISFHEAVLNGRGMVTKRLQNWPDTLEVMGEFRPDVVLMDHFISQIDAGELTRIIRMDSSFDSIPIIFLSNSDLVADRNFLMSCGGDELLTKPITPRQLFLTVETRAIRFRRIRSGMTRDSLTGLLDHKNLIDQLESEIARARRSRSELTYCLIDLDNFKTINDTYGHSRGDQVLKALAHLMVRRLRKSDAIGRYGGEEFGIVLPGASPENAAQVINDIRTSFAEMQFGSGKSVSNVTFSGGLASLSDYNNSEELMDAADQALYRAKKQGRNRLIISTHRY